jgi:hypothetical protein
VSIKSLVKEQGAVPTLINIPLMGPLYSAIGNLEVVSATKSSPSDPTKPFSSDYIKPSIKFSYWKTALSRISQLETDRGSMNCVITTFRSQSQVVQAELKLLDEQNDELKAQVARLNKSQTDIRARFKGVAGDVEQAHSVVRAEVRSELLKLEQG